MREVLDGIHGPATTAPVLSAAQVTTQQSFAFTHSETRIAATAFALCVIGRFHGLLPGYSIDDYGLLSTGTNARVVTQALAQGRALVSVLYLGLAKIDVLPLFAPVLGWFVLTVALIGTGLMICRIWGIERNPFASAIAVFLIVLHPYQTELFTFRITSLFVATALSLSLFALTYCVRSRIYWTISVLMLSASLMIYQVVANYVAMTLLFATLFELTAKDEGRRTRFPRNLLSRALAATTALITYMAVNQLITFISGVQLHDRTRLLDIDDIWPRFKLAAQQLGVLFVRSEPIIPAATKWVLLSLIAAWFVWSLVRRLRRPANEWKQPELIFTAVLALGMPAALGLVLVLHEWWPVPRVTSHISIFWAGAVAFCLIQCTGIMRRVLTGLAVLAILAFIGSDNHILLDQLRLNMRDLAKANRIVMRLESLPDFAQLRGVVVNGGHWAYPFEFRTMQGGLNVSALFAAWSKIPLLNEVSGYRFQQAPPDIQAAAAAYCNNAKKWPAAESVTSIQSFGVVCLAKP